MRATIVIVAALCLTASALAARSDLADAQNIVEPGWGIDGAPLAGVSESAEEAGDATYAGSAADCGANSVLLFRVRGSGASYGNGQAWRSDGAVDGHAVSPRSVKGQDNLGGWAAAAGTALIANGWQVRDLQAEYSAPGVPVPQIEAAWKKVLSPTWTDLLPGVALTDVEAAVVKTVAAIRSYRDAASRQWQQVRSQLVAAAARCPSARILIAGYSQGAIILRYVIPTLSGAIRSQIESVDLVADPTADDTVDDNLAASGPASFRKTSEGLDTLAGRIEHDGARAVAESLLGPVLGRHVFRFHQTPYPAWIAPQVYQYCLAHDIVCDVALGSIRRIGSEGRIHSSYPWEAIGDAAGARLGVAPSPPTNVATIVPTIGPTLVDLEDTAANYDNGDQTFTEWSAATGENVDVDDALSASLSGYRCVVLDLNQSLASGDEAELTSFLSAGGTVVALGEHSDGDGFDAADSTLNVLASALGVGLSLNDDSNDSGDTVTGNIDTSPLTDGVAAIGYNWASSLAISSSAYELVASADDSYSLIGAQSVDGGTFVMSGDTNAFTDNNDGFYDDDDNGTLVDDLCP